MPHYLYSLITLTLSHTLFYQRSLLFISSSASPVLFLNLLLTPSLNVFLLSHFPTSLLFLLPLYLLHPAELWRHQRFFMNHSRRLLLVFLCNFYRYVRTHFNDLIHFLNIPTSHSTHHTKRARR